MPRKNGAPPRSCFPLTIRIDRIGADGDGIAIQPDHTTLYLPFTLPGETVSVAGLRKRGEGWTGDAEILAPSPDRITPPCPHFGTCGGCSLQHWRIDAYLSWKRDALQSALRRAGYADAPVAPAIVTPPSARRRIDLAIRRGAGITLGLHAARSDAVLDITTCAVLHPTLLALLAPLRNLLRGLGALRRQGDAILNLLDTGPDLLLRLDAPLTTVDRTRLAAFAATHGLRRISIAIGKGAPETGCLMGPPSITFAGVTVTPPPGAFLQASAIGEAAVAQAVLAGLPDKLPGRARIAELYAGCGTLTFHLVNHARISALEGDADAVNSLRAAANASGLAGRITAETRDLARRPLAASELKAFDVIVLDPPHAGAATQITEIAAAGVRRVIYVSCNPAALARDAERLAQSGYQVLTATPIDQFLWSARLESVVVFDRPRRSG